MYERLDKLRAEVERCKRKVEDDRLRLKAAEQKLQEAENSQILADVGALNLSPEQLADFLKLVANGQVGSAGTVSTVSTVSTVTAVNKETEVETKDDDDYDLEGLDDEEN
ncbi:MAG: DUF4315 family protein [Butyrivibrio sp.]|nr:DUF4315 family protein [Butyrivibrio sp.]